MLEVTRIYRAENDVDFKEFITDLRMVKNGEKQDFKTYGTTKCRKSLCWTEKTRKSINYKWMHEYKWMHDALSSTGIYRAAGPWEGPGAGRSSGRTRPEYTAASRRRDHATFGSGPTRQSDDRDSEPDYLLRPTRHGINLARACVRSCWTNLNCTTS